MNDELVPENYNSPNLVKMWREFIDWNKRRAGEDNFLVNQFHKYNVRKVFDASLGDGCDSIYLIKQGFDVTSNEIDKTFLNKALENAKKENITFKITNLDWRKLDSELAEETFDAVILLGNSLTYLFSKQAQLEALSQFKKILKNNGILIIDERNYQYILDNRDEILKGNFRYSGKYVYCGEKVHSKPIEISEDKVKFEYTDETTGKKGFLILYPFKRRELKNLLIATGFRAYAYMPDFIGFNEAQMERMTSALCTIGVFNLFFGVESFGLEQITRANKAAVSVIESKRVIEALGANGIKTTMAYLLGLPGETEESLALNLRSLEVLLATGYVERIYLSMAMALRGTPMFEELCRTPAILEAYKQSTGNNLVDDDYPDYSLLQRLGVEHLSCLKPSFVNEWLEKMIVASERYLPSHCVGGFLLESV